MAKSSTKIQVWNEQFTCWEDVVREFGGWHPHNENEIKKHKKPTEVIYAYYSHDGYSGAAFVLWRKGRKYYTLHGSHCSCYGLEETGFDPEEWTKKELIGYLEKANYISGLNNEVRALIIKKLKRKPRAKKVPVSKPATAA